MTKTTPESTETARVSAHVDGFEGSWLIGWAWAGAKAKPCVISVCDEHGVEIADGKASLERPDLAALDRGRTDFAFRIRVPDLDTMELVRVFADGIEMRGSPLPVGPGHFDGQLNLSRGFAVGWVSERVDRFTPPKIDIVRPGGEIVASAPSERDPNDSEPGSSPARFRIPLTPLFGSADIALKARANGVVFGRAVGNFRLTEHLELATSGHCSGWMFSPDAPWTRFSIELRRDGELVATVPCDRVRPDVRARYPGSNAFGFDAPLPPAAKPNDPCELSFRLPGSQKELFGGPFIVGERGGIIAAARRLAEHVHDTESTLSVAERSFLQRALAGFIQAARQDGSTYRTPKFAQVRRSSTRRLTIVVPVYRGVEVTEKCIGSVLKHRNPETDFVLLVNDASPEPGMAAMLAALARNNMNIQVLTNKTNEGFIKSVNRAFRAASDGDVVLLNSDTEVFAGAFDELSRVAHMAPEIGTVTPLSNNATIFSYPHAQLRRSELLDMPWSRLAQVARLRNSNAIVDVPTAHGFCMLIRREVLERIDSFDESFGRGYGEENDFCAKAADLGFRNVAAGSAFVFHQESVSFGTEKVELLATNLATIAGRYPEYQPTIMAFEREDGMRSLRWSLDEARLAEAREAGAPYTLVVTHSLDGGTAEAIRDIARACEPATSRQIVLSCRNDGFIQLNCDEPLLRASFSPSERQALFRMIAAAEPALIAIHQILGFDAGFVREFADMIAPFRSIFYAHDYFSLCPRVTMIDAAGHFCGRPPTDVCDRCVAVGGRHNASRLETANTKEHLALTHALLSRVTQVVAPSASAARYIKEAFPDLDVQAIPHPESGREFPAKARPGSENEILLLGAIGPHKGSAKLLEIARLARLKYPKIRFRVVGYTDLDRELFLSLGNVAITGVYTPAQLPELMAQCRGRLALFLHQWPETYSYALSEAVSYGFIPLVPDIGAPAARVRETGFGWVFPFPIDAGEVLALIDDIATGRRPAFLDGASPAAFRRSPEDVARLRALFAMSAPSRTDTRVA